MSKFNTFEDIDPIETTEWLESIDSVIREHGPERAHFLLDQMIDYSHRSGTGLPYSPSTAYLNTISANQQPVYPGDRVLERRIEAYIRWNAMAMVVHANRKSTEFGGHISSYASSATLYEVGFNHFWRADNDSQNGDMIFMQGHSAPGIYARSFLEGRFTEKELNRFRQEVGGGGLSSYPHPWLMPNYWQFPTVSMGLGPMMAIYQARFMRYMENRGLVTPSDRKIWAFLGDGEMDEPESMGAITMPVQEGLDNLVFVVNCNLQRLDGPVRGNGKIIQELEAAFSGAGWNVIKVIWGSKWDPLIEKDQSGKLRQLMGETVDGEYQKIKSMDGKYVRNSFFGKHAETAELVSKMSDDEIWHLNRGGHDPAKVYAAYDAAVKHKGGPTIILAKTVKGFGMGSAGEGQNTAHQQKKLDVNELKKFRDRFNIPVSDNDIEDLPYYKPAANSPELEYMLERRNKMGGFLPARRAKSKSLQVPALDTFKAQLEGTGDREASTTMAFIRILTTLTRDKEVGKHIVPIVPDEARTFGMEGMFRQVGIYSSKGQLYEPQDSGELMYYREDKKGQILEEGINEAGSYCSWAAAGTAYSNHDVPMIPFYIYYSMFGFQRIGDFMWAGGDQQARGFLMGGTAGRTTLAGEGLQHQDGHSLVTSSTIPNCRSYDPTYAYELAVIIQDGMRRMFTDQENVFYYITCMNENYSHPPMPKGVEEGILRGMYLLKSGKKGKIRAQLMGSGTILREVLGAADLLKKDFDVQTDIWSVTSFNELRRNALEVERWNQLHPAKTQKKCYIEECFASNPGPFIAATDYMKIISDQIQRWIPGRFISLGTDGYGRSDARKPLRKHFEVDKHYIAVTALKALADDGILEQKIVAEAIKKYGIDPDRPDPVTL
ncbi:MAG: pyruvate dehydrogenase (acetyl-transferring), homodimeric type [Woeseia sp.]|nr:pyruvate dehydrogenase (acetyl-transferring), homodimeric type [Woeseia sp.]|tara:strand:+ start:718 stop:3381 length:2664 start_codon:yes stop_codon:yes gene_type:complete